MLRTPKLFPNGFGADSVSLTLAFDSDVVTPLTDNAAPGWNVQTVLIQPGLERIKLLKLPGTTLQPDSVICSVHFQTNLARRTSTSVVLEEVDWDADSSYFNCIAPLPSSSDTVMLNVTLSCGDSLILAQLRGQPLFTVLSVSPNPASNQVHASFNRVLDAPVRAQLFNALGAVIKDVQLQESPLTIQIADVPSGSYYLRFSQNGFSQTRKVVVAR